MLEGQMREQQHLQLEMINLREQVESNRREMETYIASTDDDARSVATLMESDDAEERVRLRRGETETEDGQELASRVQTLSAEIAEALQLSRVLQTQHSEAMSAVRSLTERVVVLEEGIAARVAEEVGKTEQRWKNWKDKFEEGWRRERESWNTERERLRGVVREWEEASRRGREEVEDRALNDSISGEDYSDEDEPVWREAARPHNTRKNRRRRPSHRTTLAVRALKSVVDETGASTPKAETQILENSPSEPNVPNEGLRSSRRRGNKLKHADPGADETSESDRDSGDTMKESDKITSREKSRNNRPVIHQPVPIFTVLIVAVVAGALYWKHRE